MADETALPNLEAALTKPHQRGEVIIRLAQILGRVGGPQAIAILQNQVRCPDELARTYILLALSKCGFQAETATEIEKNIEAELAQATWVAATISALGDDEAASLLRASLAQQLNRHRLRVLLWLSFIYDSNAVRRVQQTLGVGLSLNGAENSSAQQKSYALETIDVLLPPDQKAKILGVVP